MQLQSSGLHGGNLLHEFRDQRTGEPLGSEPDLLARDPQENVLVFRSQHAPRHGDERLRYVRLAARQNDGLRFRLEPERSPQWIYLSVRRSQHQSDRHDVHRRIFHFLGPEHSNHRRRLHGRLGNIHAERGDRHDYRRLGHDGSGHLPELPRRAHLTRNLHHPQRQSVGRRQVRHDRPDYLHKRRGYLLSRQ